MTESIKPQPQNYPYKLQFVSVLYLLYNYKIIRHLNFINNNLISIKK